MKKTDKVKITVKKKLKPYNTLNTNFTQVANSMFFYIKDRYCFCVYFYLCMRYNRSCNYAFPSYNTIAKDCQMSVSKTKECVKWLCDNKYIIKGKVKNDSMYQNNIYYIMYLEVEEKEVDKQLEIELEDNSFEFEEDGSIILENENEY